MLKINMEYRKGILFIRLKGNLNAYTAPKFESYTLPVIKDYGIRYVVYNLSELVSLDKRGEDALHKGGLECDKNNGKVLIVNNSINSCLEFDKIKSELMAMELLKV